jgi:hypothetical protein
MDIRKMQFYSALFIGVKGDMFVSENLADRLEQLYAPKAKLRFEKTSFNAVYASYCGAEASNHRPSAPRLGSCAGFLGPRCDDD